MSQMQATTTTFAEAEALTTRVSRAPAILLAVTFAVAAYAAGHLIQLDAGPSLAERNARASAFLAAQGVDASAAALVQ